MWAFTGFATILVSAFLMPLAYMASTSLKTAEQLTAPDAPLWPAVPETFEYQGKRYPVYEVPTADGRHQWALVEPGREASGFVDPANPDAGVIQWKGRWRTLTQSWRFAAQRRELLGGLECHRLPAPAVQHGRDRDHRDDRRGGLVDLRRLRLQPVPVPRQERALPDPVVDDHPAVPGHPDPDLRSSSPRSAGPAPGCR